MPCQFLIGLRLLGASWGVFFERLLLPVNLLRFNDHRLAALTAEELEPEFRSRTSRLQKWKELAAEANKSLQIPTENRDRLQKLSWNILEHFLVNHQC